MPSWKWHRRRPCMAPCGCTRWHHRRRRTPRSVSPGHNPVRVATRGLAMLLAKVSDSEILGVVPSSERAHRGGRCVPRNGTHVFRLRHWGWRPLRACPKTRASGVSLPPTAHKSKKQDYPQNSIFEYTSLIYQVKRVVESRCCDLSGLGALKRTAETPLVPKRRDKGITRFCSCGLQVG
jgi:hypothetical protein